VFFCSNFDLFKVLNFAEGKVIELYAKHINCETIRIIPLFKIKKSRIMILLKRLGHKFAARIASQKNVRCIFTTSLIFNS
jgi:hypothetical protein